MLICENSLAWVLINKQVSKYTYIYLGSEMIIVVAAFSVTIFARIESSIH